MVVLCAHFCSMVAFCVHFVVVWFDPILGFLWSIVCSFCSKLISSNGVIIIVLYVCFTSVWFSPILGVILIIFCVHFAPVCFVPIRVIMVVL